MARIAEQVIVRKGAAPTGDQGLCRFMQRIYALMTLGLALSGLVAYQVASSPEALRIVFQTGWHWAVLLVPFALVIFLSAAVQKMAWQIAFGTFLLYSAIMGASLSFVFLAYSQQSIASTFLIVSGVFGGMCLYGYTTHRDLTSMGSFMIMGLIGIIIASLVNLFFKSSTMNYVVSLLGVAIFTGLTAFDVQKLRLSYDRNDDASLGIKKVVMGALSLYLDFVNMFLYMLRLFGDNRK